MLQYNYTLPIVIVLLIMVMQKTEMASDPSHPPSQNILIILVNFYPVIIFRDNYFVFLTGRSIAGLAIGTLHFLIPLYINDIIPAHQKTSCHSMMQLQFVLGIVTQYVLSKYTH